jgi:hypothetical protein
VNERITTASIAFAAGAVLAVGTMDAFDDDAPQLATPTVAAHEAGTRYAFESVSFSVPLVQSGESAGAEVVPPDGGSFVDVSVPTSFVVDGHVVRGGVHVLTIRNTSSTASPATGFVSFTRPLDLDGGL